MGVAPNSVAFTRGGRGSTGDSDYASGRQASPLALTLDCTPFFGVAVPGW
jgi:hypothetical protein